MDLFSPFSSNDLISNCASIFNQNSSSSSMQVHSSEFGHSDLTTRPYQFVNHRSLSASDLFTPSVFVTIPMQNQSPTGGINTNNNNASSHDGHNNVPEHRMNFSSVNYNNSSNKNNNEIKSEPIKIELSENNQSKEKTTLPNVSIISSTLISTNSTGNRSSIQNEPIKCKTNLLPLPSSNSLLVTARPKKSIVCYKCEKCPFISISQNCLTEHYEHNHNQDLLVIKNNSKKLTCPGCDNIFYIRQSLETHLLNDHQMNVNEIEMLVNSLIDCSSSNNSTQGEDSEFDGSGGAGSIPQKNRISIKNVKILQNPNLINSNELFNDNTFGQNINVIGDTSSNSNCNQKIYLKNPIYLLNNNNTNKIYEQSLLPLITSSSSSFDGIFNEQNYIEMNHHHHNSDGQHHHESGGGGGEEHDNNNYIIDLNGNSNSNNNNNCIIDDKHSLIDGGQNQPQQIPNHNNNSNGLHLRTVDELNLLDLNDVENNFLLNSNRQNNCDNNNEKVVVLQQCNIINNTNVLDATNANDNFIFIENDNEMDQNGYDDGANDDNIDFVCAEEIINENHYGPNDYNAIPTVAVDHLYSNIVDCDDDDDDEFVKKNNRGRPKGSKQTGITQLKKMYVNLTAKEIGYKCSIPLCAMRFHSKDVLIYHERCHSISNSEIIICPECTNDCRAWNWNTLHTHLWRYHNIDMELYSCKLCNFKTPILSRLNNTHIKIHSAERNFKCDQCEKAFKNTKQLKNHRRLHRINSQLIKHEYKKCSKCSSIFKDVTGLKLHMETNHSNNNNSNNIVMQENNSSKAKFKCPHCDKVTNSKSNLKLHILIHMDNKKFKCDKESCCYATNDHNAFRRHKMKHNQNKRYKCSFCNYTSIQSTTFKNHILKNHAAKAPDLVFQCKSCAFVTINKQKYSLHLKKHENSSTPADTHSNNSIDKLIDDSTHFIDLEELDESTHRDIAHNNHTTSSTSSPNDIILATTTTLEQPLIRPAVFANNFSNIENFRFPKILDLNDKFDTVNFSNIYDDTINYNHINDQADNFSDSIVRVYPSINDDNCDNNNKDCFNIDLT